MKQNLIIMLVSLMALTVSAQTTPDNKELSDEEKLKLLESFLNESSVEEEYHTPLDMEFINISQSFIESAPEDAKQYVQQLVNAGLADLERLKSQTPIETTESKWILNGKEYIGQVKCYDLAPTSGHRYIDLDYVNDYNFSISRVANGADPITGEVGPDRNNKTLLIEKLTCRNYIYVQTDRRFSMYTPKSDYVWGSIKGRLWPTVTNLPGYSYALWSKYLKDRVKDKDAFVAYGDAVLECVDDNGNSFNLRNGKFYYTFSTGFDKSDPFFIVRRYYRDVEKDGDGETQYSIPFHVNDTIKDIIKNGKVLTFLLNENDTVKFSTHANRVFEFSIHRPDFIARKRYNAPSTVEFIKDASIYIRGDINGRIPIDAGSVLTCPDGCLKEDIYSTDDFIKDVGHYFVKQNLPSRDRIAIKDPSGEEVFCTNVYGDWRWKYENDYMARREANEKLEREAKKKPIYDAYCAQYGKKYIDAALDGKIILGAPIAMVKELFEWGLYYDDGASQSYEVIQDTPLYDFDAKKIVPLKFHAYPTKVILHIRNGRVASKVIL